MLNRLLPLALLCAFSALGSVARGDNLTVKLFPYTGEVRFSNPNATPFSFVFYALNSPGGALNGNAAVWNSITDDYDVSGNGYIDPLNNWFKLSTSATQLAEAVIPNPGGSLAPYRSVSLGNVWNPIAINPSVSAQVVQADNQFATVSVIAAIDGDYNGDGIVSVPDYNLWKLAYGQSGTPLSLSADGNLDGVVDAGDYTVWRNNRGKSLVSVGFGSGSLGLAVGLGQGIAVPEPAAMMMLLSAVGCFALMRRSRSLK